LNPNFDYLLQLFCLRSP